ncbi:hypothetical protein BH09SUM1_BH09SUM1_21840 [soil metagenome]
MFFLVLLIALPALTILWWFAADRAVRGRRGARVAVALFTASLLAMLALLFTIRGAGLPMMLPKLILAPTYLWYLLVLPMTVIAMAVGYGTAVVIRVAKKFSRPRETVIPENAEPNNAAMMSRRELLRATVAVAPPLLLLGATGRAIADVDDFDIRTLDLPVVDLPPVLDGLTITHLSDVHVGRFTNGKTLSAIVEAVNGLNSEAVVFTGDLIDYAMRDLPEGIAMLKDIVAPGGIYFCEGNHDLFEDRAGFERAMFKAQNVNFLLNEAAVSTIRGSAIQWMGLQWGGARGSRGEALAANFEAMMKNSPIASDAFPILLAHHPHALDVARGAKIPLTLAGHTHGGQLMLTRGVGAGPMMWKYWSGIYRSGAATTFINNGAGNWFPLRINAPAEVVQLRLRRENRNA